MLAMVSLTLALPAGSLPGRSIERDLPREEPVIPVTPNYHKFSSWNAHVASICLLSAIMLSTTTFKMVSSAWLTPAVKSNVTEWSKDSIVTVAPTESLSLSRKTYKYSFCVVPLWDLSRYHCPSSRTVYSYTADENGFHPIITEEAAPNLRSTSAVHSMYSSDHPEQIKVTINEDDVELARRQSEAYAAAQASKSRARLAQDSSNSDSAVKTRTDMISQSINQEVARASRMMPANSTVRRRVVFE